VALVSSSSKEGEADHLPFLWPQAQIASRILREVFPLWGNEMQWIRGSQVVKFPGFGAR
jgi:hypothetical protein